MIREANLQDVPKLVDIHREALSQDLLPRLGSKFLKSTFYPALMDDRGTKLWVLEEAGEIRSFAAFSENTDVITRAMLHRPMNTGFALAKAIARHPAILLELISLLRSGNGSQRQANPEIYVVATAYAFRCQGLAHLVVQHGLEHLKGAGIYEFCSVRTSSAQAAQFYRKIGFVDEREEQRGSRRLHVLNIRLLPRNQHIA